MSEIKIDTLEQNYDQIMKNVGNKSYVNWQLFTKGSSEVVKNLDDLVQIISVVRECNHKNFIKTMKKLKSLDIPDLMMTVKANKLPKQALRSILHRFKLNQKQLELVQSAENLKQAATKQFQNYMLINGNFVNEIKKYINYFKDKYRQNSQQNQQQIPNQIKQIKSTVEFKLSDDKIKQVVSHIQIQYLPQTDQLIALSTYQQIVNSTFDVIKQRYREITEQSRKKQRNVIQNQSEYLKVMIQYLNNTQALISQGQQAIARKVGLSPKKFQQSQMALMQRGMDNHLMGIQAGLRARIKQSLIPSKDVSLQVAKQLIRYQVSIIKDQLDYLKKVLDGLQKTAEAVQMIPMILALILNDMAYEKFGYEQEDFLKNMSQQAIMGNQELIGMFKQMEIGIINLMQKLQLVPEEQAKFMKQQIEAPMNPMQQLAMQQQGMMNMQLQQGMMGMPQPQPNILGMQPQQGMMGMPQPPPPQGMMGMPQPSPYMTQGLDSKQNVPIGNPFDMLQSQKMQMQMFNQMKTAHQKSTAQSPKETNKVQKEVSNPLKDLTKPIETSSQETKLKESSEPVEASKQETKLKESSEPVEASKQETKLKESSEPLKQVSEPFKQNDPKESLEKEKNVQDSKKQESK